MKGADAALYNPRTVEEVFRDFKGRRAGMIKALTSGLFLCLFLFCFFSSFVTNLGLLWFLRKPRKEFGVFSLINGLILI